MGLSDMEIRRARAGEKRYMLADGGGLNLEVMTSGAKYWRLRYWQDGKEIKLTLGEYPAVSLREARGKRDDLKRGKAQGIDPKAVLHPVETPVFEAVAREWLETHIRPIRTPKHTAVLLSRMERYLFPVLGKRPVDKITAPELLAVLRSIEAIGIIETAHRVKALASAVFRYAIATGRAERDPAADLRGALQPKGGPSHFASIIDPKELGGLLRAVTGMKRSFVAKYATLFSIHVFLRPGEVRKLEWTEVNFESGEIRISAEKMKARKEHVVPLSTQALNILEKVRSFTGAGRYVFPARDRPDGSRPMSENAVLGTLRRLGYTQEEIVPHGFRATASTLLYEQGWSADVIERQLAHLVGSNVRQAYDHSQMLPERRKMMQAWSDYLDSLKG
jgi:integrase